MNPFRPILVSRPVRSLAAAFIAALAIINAAPAQVVPTEMPQPVRGLEVENRSGQTIPLALPFTDPVGKVVSLRDLFNKPAASGKAKRPVVVQMMYYRCPILCPAVLEKFTSTLKTMDFSVGKEFDVLIVSVDPRDTPSDAAAQKAAQVAAYGRPGDDVRDGWHFLVGGNSSDSPRKLADSLGFPYRHIPDNGEYAHGAVLFVLTPEGKISRYFTGLNYPATDVRRALLEASDGKIGTVFDAWTMWCYHFDPSAGGYTLAAMKIMRVGAAVSVVIVGGLLLAMWRFELIKKLRGTATLRVASQGTATLRVASSTALSGAPSDSPGQSATRSVAVPGLTGQTT